MEAVQSNIFWLKHLNHYDEDLVGTQAIHQAHLLSALPDSGNGFVIGFKGFTDFLFSNHLYQLITEKINQLPSHQSKLFSQTCTFIQSQINHAQIPQPLSLAIAQAYHRLNPRHQILVRVSAPPRSFPESYFLSAQNHPLILTGDANLLHQIKTLWTLAFDSDLIQYQKIQGLNHPPQIAIIVQAVAFPQISGSTFSIDPVSRNKNRIVIEAIRGLFQNIDSHSISPDHYQLTKQPYSIHHQHISLQSFSTQFKHHAIKTISLPKHLHLQPKLTPIELQKLAKISEKLQHYFLAPQHFQWWLANNQFQVLSSQPLHDQRPKITPISSLNHLQKITEGMPASSGIVSGPVNFFRTSQIKPGDIVVVKNLSPKLLPYLAKAGGVIVEIGGLTSAVASFARDLQIPCVVGVSSITKLCKPGQIITLNGSTGDVYTGGIKRTFRNRTSSGSPQDWQLLTTATKLFVSVSDEESVSYLGKSNIDGLVVSGLRDLVLTSGYHPYQLVQKRTLINSLVHKLLTYQLNIGQRPLFYQLFDLPSHQLISLKNGANFESKEINSDFGYRGSHRLISDSRLFNLEVSIIKSWISQSNQPLNLIFPFIRSSQEILQIKKALISSQLQLTHLRFWYSLSASAALPSITQPPSDFLSGFIINQPQLFTSSLAIDPDNSELISSYEPTNIFLSSLLRPFISPLTSPIIIDTPHLNQDLLSFFVNSGIFGFITSYKSLPYIKQTLSDIETHRFNST